MNRKHFMHRRVAAALAAALIGAAGAVGAAETDAPVAPEFKKFDTNRDGYLSREEARRIRGFDKSFSVETRKGTVVLSGFVDSDSQLRRAQEIAAGVLGVVTVKNGLVVKS